jgi:Protein of unknown function (DUF3489)
MPTFTIDTDNNVTAYTTPDEVAKADASLPRFSSEAELAKLAADWPADRLIDLWNSIPGNSTLTKLGPKAAARIWKALQPLTAANGEAAKPTKARRPAKAARATKETAKQTKRAAKGKKAAAAKQAKAKKGSTAAQGGPRESSKKAEIIALMQRAKGASLPEIQELGGWQKHTVRGFISILSSKSGLKIESEKNAAGERVYRMAK